MRRQTERGPVQALAQAWAVCLPFGPRSTNVWGCCDCYRMAFEIAQLTAHRNRKIIRSSPR